MSSQREEELAPVSRTGCCAGSFLVLSLAFVGGSSSDQYLHVLADEAPCRVATIHAGYEVSPGSTAVKWSVSAMGARAVPQMKTVPCRSASPV